MDSLLKDINPIIQLVHNGWYYSVDTVMVNGNIIVENKELNIDINLDELKNKITEIRKRLM